MYEKREEKGGEAETKLRVGTRGEVKRVIWRRGEGYVRKRERFGGNVFGDEFFALGTYIFSFFLFILSFFFCFLTRFFDWF